MSSGSTKLLAFNDDLLNSKIIGSDGKIGDVTKLAAFFGFNFKAGKVEIKI